MSSIPGSVGQCPMFIEPMITWVPSGFSRYNTKIVLKKRRKKVGSQLLNSYFLFILTLVFHGM